MDQSAIPLAAALDWRAVSALAGFIVAWSGIMLWGVQHLLGRLEAKLDRESGEWRRVERSLQEMRAELPLHYVRREDAIRQETVFHAKLDALAAKIDAWREKMT